jgi:hypothetical protein
LRFVKQFPGFDHLGDDVAFDLLVYQQYQRGYDGGCDDQRHHGPRHPLPGVGVLLCLIVHQTTRFHDVSASVP